MRNKKLREKNSGQKKNHERKKKIKKKKFTTEKKISRNSFQLLMKTLWLFGLFAGQKKQGNYHVYCYDILSTKSLI